MSTEVHGLRGVEFFCCLGPYRGPCYVITSRMFKNFFSFLQVFAHLSSSAVCLLLRECLLFALSRGDDFPPRILPLTKPLLHESVGRGYDSR
jgi:hypothetical protein